MSGRPLSIEEILTLLTEAPSRIAELTADLTPAQLRTAPDHDEWSANDVLAHLRSCADVWGDCMATMLAEDTPTLRAIDPRTWTRSTNYPKLEFQPSFHSFTIQRAELLTVLRSLSPAEWERSAHVTGAGKLLERTVQMYAQRLARHERTHFKQIARITSTLRT